MNDNLHYPLASLCTTCENLFSLPGSTSSIVAGNFYAHYPPRLLEEWQHCDFCCDILGTLEMSYQSELGGWLERPSRLRRNTETPDELENERSFAKSGFCLRLTKSTGTPMIHFKLTADKSEASFARPALVSRAAARSGLVPRPNLDMRSSETYSLVRQWLGECRQRHAWGNFETQSRIKNKCTALGCQGHLQEEDTKSAPICSLRSEPPLPMRLIDLNPQSSENRAASLAPRIVSFSAHDSDGMAPYAALSYCWGGEQRHALMIKDIHRYSTSLPVSELPRSIQDAIWVTHQLNIRFLWVDSLSIVQDDTADKNAQIAKMGAIFSNSLVTICASSAESCHKGFLGERQPHQTFVTLPLSSEGNEMGLISFATRRDGQPGMRPTWIPRDPIFARAWTMQEAFMAPRVLIFSSFQIFWMCSRTFGADGGVWDREHWLQWTGLKCHLEGGSVDELVVQRSNMASWLQLSQEEVHHMWRSMVEIYSERLITDPLDKLPAILGVAKYAADLMRRTDEHIEYLAGLWSYTLIEDLCWFRAHNATGTRPSLYRAPSWSYMSRDGNIEFLDTKPRIGNFDSLITIKHCSTTPAAHNDSFGRLQDGILLVHGHVLPCIRTTNLAHGRFGVQVIQEPDLEGIVLLDVLDASTGRGTNPSSDTQSPTSTDSERLLCLVLAEYMNVKEWDPPDKDPDDVVGLMLEQLLNGKYCRIGWFMAGWGWKGRMREETKRTVTIV